jgi:small nuclear ribonucleoprotein (snRNP)-like protein
MTIDELRPYQGKTVTVRLHDGEVTTVKIVFVDAEYEDIIADIIQTNRPVNYKEAPDSAYTIRAADIATISEI